MASQHLIFHHCKNGDLKELKKQLAIREVDLNIRDRWDSTPLYYACLCGHQEVVEFLLENGSKCEASTFDGERCLYGALTNEIRNLLKNWKQVHSVGRRREKHYEHLRHMFEEEQALKDITFEVGDCKFRAHRCLLAVRSPYFAEALATKWKNRDVIKIRSGKVCARAFHAMLQFVYLGRVDIDCDLVEDLKILANQCRLPHLPDEINVAQKKMSDFVSLKPGMAQKVKILSVESEVCFYQLWCDLRHLAELSMPRMLRDWVDGVLPFSECWSQDAFFPDLVVEVEGCKFMCHKVFLCGKSDYFKALVADHFNENTTDERSSISVIKLHHISPKIFKQILIYIYSGRNEFKSLDMAFDILHISDMMLLPGLKRLCGNALAQNLDESNVVAMYRISQTFELTYLEDACTSYMAQDLEKMTELEEFTDLVMEEAYSVVKREEIDSVPVVDDIRYHVTSMATTYGLMEEAKSKLARLDAMLSRLGIDG